MTGDRGPVAQALATASPDLPAKGAMDLWPCWHTRPERVSIAHQEITASSKAILVAEESIGQRAAQAPGYVDRPESLLPAMSAREYGSWIRAELEPECRSSELV